MRSHRSLWLIFIVVGVFQVIAPGSTHSATPRNSPPVAASPDEGGTPSQPENSVSIPGPLRSFLRMAGMRQRVSDPEVLPLLARNVILNGYQIGRPTEYLILLRHYFAQAKELRTLAGSDENIHVKGCNDAGQLLNVLGYKTRGECGHPGMTLITSDSQRAFLTIDSGFPLVDLEEALQKDGPFAYPYAGSSVPAMFGAADWKVLAANGHEDRDLIEILLYEPDVARLYWALSRIDPDTRVALKNDIGLEKLRPFAAALDHYGSQICIRGGAVVVPGGQKAAKEWQNLAERARESRQSLFPNCSTKTADGWRLILTPWREPIRASKNISLRVSD